MTATITATIGTGSTTPVLVLGYATARTSRNRVHDLLSGGIAVALIAPRPRAGDLSLLYADEAAAWSAFNLHAAESAFTLTDDERPGIGMTYVLAEGGAMRVELDDETRERWVCVVPYQELSE